MTPFIEHSGKSTTDPWLPGDEGRRRSRLWRVQEHLGERWKCSTSWLLQDYMHLPKFTELYYKKVNRTLCKFTSINLTHTTPQKYLLARFKCVQPGFRITALPLVHIDRCLPWMALLQGAQPWLHIRVPWGPFQNCQRPVWSQSDPRLLWCPRLQCQPSLRAPSKDKGLPRAFLLEFLRETF